MLKRVLVYPPLVAGAHNAYDLLSLGVHDHDRALGMVGALLAN